MPPPRGVVLRSPFSGGRPGRPAGRPVVSKRKTMKTILFFQISANTLRDFLIKYTFSDFEPRFLSNVFAKINIFILGTSSWIESLS